MALLTVLTLIYAAILVLVLAGTLIIILFYLWRIGSSLATTQKTLNAVAEATQPLETPLAQLEQATDEWRQMVAQAESSLITVDERLLMQVKQAVPNESVAQDRT